MNQYLIKKPAELSDTDIKIILDCWNVDEWNGLGNEEFRKKFEKSEFHLLMDPDSKMLCVARINFHFKVKIDEVKYPIAELVGFVAIDVLKGYGKELLGHLKNNLTERKIEAIGFCKNKTSPFYSNSGLNIFYYKVWYLREWRDNRWYTPQEDDDIINLTLNDQTAKLFEKLDENNLAYLLFE
jgi:hypothetical protein